MLLERLQDLSIYYYIKSLLSSTPFIKVVDGFPVENLEIPSVSIEADTIDVKPWELGNRNGLFIRVWFIDVFAVNKSQRDEISYTILHALENTIPVYDYNEGFPPANNPSQLGCMNVEDIKLEIIRINPDLVTKLYYRSSISFTAYYNKL